MPLISPYYIHDIIESLDVVKESLKCQRLISEAKDYMLLQDRRGELYGPRARPRRSTGSLTASVSIWSTNIFGSCIYNSLISSYLDLILKFFVCLFFKF